MRINVDTTNVINNSKIKSTTTQLEVLASEVKFVPTTKSINAIDMIANTESSLKITPTIIKQAVVSEI
ncbi:unnamed protein product, partial [Rotaria sordida]